MLTFKLFAISGLVLLVIWLALGKTVRIPAFSFAGKTARIPTPRFTTPARKDVCGLSVIHLVYFAVTLGGCLLLRQPIWLDDRMSAMGIPPAEVGPFVAGVLYTIAAVAGVLLLLSLYFTVRRAAVWFTVACHSTLVLCLCWLIRDRMTWMSGPNELQLTMSQYITAYLGIVAVYAAVFFLYTKIRKATVPAA